MTDLHAQIEAGEASIAALEAQISGLETELDAERGALAEAAVELESAQAEFDARLAEMRAYRIEREVSVGESHLSTQLGSVLVFDQSGLSQDVTVRNSADSANAMVFELLVDGAAVYTSEPLEPGEELTSIQLAAALEPGNYEAVAVQSARDAEGNALSSVRVPVEMLITATSTLPADANA